jgi:hypothetical protein
MKAKREWWQYLGIVLLVLLGIAGLVMIAWVAFLAMAMNSYGSNK